MKNKTEVIKVVKEGLPINEQHSCSWVNSCLKSGTQFNVYEYERICTVCGKVENITNTIMQERFEDVYQKFHKQEG